MGDTALEAGENTDEIEVIVEETEEDSEISLDEDGEPIQKPEDTEVEIVLSDEDSQPDKQQNIDRIVRKRVNRLNTKIAKVEEDSTFKDEKIKLLELALEQQKSPPQELKQPDYRDFDDGTDDSKYVEALQTFQKGYLDSQIQQAMAKLVPQQIEPRTNVDLERSQTRHYNNAQTLGIKDFEETEDKAIEILGKDTVNQFIQNSEKSHIVLYYLGKNPDKAEELAELINTNPVKGTLQLGALEEKLKVKPRGKTQQAPDPDTEIQGSSSGTAGKRGPKGATFT